MKTIKIAIGILVIFLTVQTNAQTLSDALRLSSFNYQGTARTMGVGNAFGALGGDQGGIYINPATLATYYKGEFVITPHIKYTNINTTYAGETDRSNADIDLGLFNMGFVFAKKGKGNWKTSNIAIGYQRITDYDETFNFSGSSEGSIVQRFQERANNLTVDELDNFEAGLAYSVGAIYDFDGDNFYETDLVATQTITKRQLVSRNGGISELGFSWAGNYNDKFHIGVGLGIPIIRFQETKTYNEVADDQKSQFNTLAFEENLRTRGSGINVKLGFLATPIKSIRIGGSIQSPTAYNLNDQYTTQMAYSFYVDNGTEAYNAESPLGRFEYRFISPLRATGSLAYLFNTETVKGFIGANINYSGLTNGSFDLLSNSMDLANDQILQDDLNDQIDFQLKNTVGLDFGGELAFDIYRIRLGYQLLNSPYAVESGFTNNSFSIGGGLRFDQFYIDLAYRRSGQTDGYSPYQLLAVENQPLVEIDKKTSQIVTTFGFMFTR